jgi:hypothetical protein
LVASANHASECSTDRGVPRSYGRRAGCAYLKKRLIVLCALSALPASFANADENIFTTTIRGVECDGASYRSSKSARDRDWLRQDVPEGLNSRIRGVDRLVPRS